MEVDSEIDSQLLQQFSSLATNDKEVLIAEFQRLLGDQLNAAGCAFYLDMNNWNLQAAICSYYDLEHPQLKLPSMLFVRDVTIGEGESIPPNTPFVKTWRIQNSGDDVWPPGCCLKFVSGVQFGHQDRVMVDSINPGSMTDISIEMISPSDTGLHEGRWRMSTATGSFFGEFIWVILQVEETGLMGVTQQMSKFGTEFIHQPVQQPMQNPFASPTKEHMLTTSVNHSTSPASNSLVCRSPFEHNPGQLGSPIGSDIAQHGSFPSSPSTQGQDNQDSAQNRMTEGIRTPLFQTPQNSPLSSNVILPSEGFTSQNESDFRDSIDML